MSYSKKLIIKIFSYISKIYLRIFGEKNSILIFMFHAILYEEEIINQKLICPNQIITVKDFNNFMEYYVNKGYTFVSPDKILNGLNKYEKYAMITFDDGYFNNKNILKILEKYKVPAVFFISTNNVKYNKGFWWDILYREGIKNGRSMRQIKNEEKLLKNKKHSQIEKYLKNKYGKIALKPVSDIDRPFTSLEIQKISQNKYVYLGNHTADHALLRNYDANEIRFQISDAQNSIYRMGGLKPTIISYPYGCYSNEIVRISKEVGLKLGVTIEPRKNYLPIKLEGEDSMVLGRFDMKTQGKIIELCEIFRTDIPIYNIINFLRRARALVMNKERC